MINARSFSREMEIPTSSRTAHSRKHFVELPWVEQRKCTTSVRIVLPIPREISAVVAFHEVVVLHVVHYRDIIDDALDQALFGIGIGALHERCETTCVLRPVVASNHYSGHIIANSIRWKHDGASWSVGERLSALDLQLLPPPLRFPSDTNLHRIGIVGATYTGLLLV